MPLFYKEDIDMGKSIIIAEKPSVGREYAKALGVFGSDTNGYIENDRWIVTWTVGHLITMSYPEKYDESLKEWKLETLPFLPKEYKYEPIKECYKQFNIVKKLYNRADVDVIYYAGDSGREGLYIQMLVRQFAGRNPRAIEKVVWIDSQTEEEILRGVSEAKDISEYAAMTDAGYMRAIEDYATGINFSRLLSVKYAIMLNSGSGQKRHKPISVGRVMTCVLGMIVNREREIRNFKVTDFYRVAGIIDIDGCKVECEWRETEESKYYQSPKLYSKFGFLKENDAKEFIASLSSDMKIDAVVRTTEKKNAPLLYNLAELQSECTKRLHISPNETLKIAQILYEKKLITYPRTDARVLTNAIAKEIDKNLAGLKNSEYGKYVDEITTHYWSMKGKYIDDSKVTDHYAIIPTGRTDASISGKESAVFDMICRRFLSVFYPPAEYERVKVDASNGNEKFFGTSKYLVQPGYYVVAGYPDEDTNSKQIVDAMNKLFQGNTYSSNYEIRKGETAPPKRYTSGSMILAMENAGTLIEDEELREQIRNNGIGTSATRAEVIEKLIRLNYIEVNEKKQVLTPSAFGEMIYEVVYATLPMMLQPETTAEWEKGLKEIEEGVRSKSDYESELFLFIRKECERIKAEDNTEDIVKRIRPFTSNRIQYEYKEFDPYNTAIKCPLCGDDVETTRWGFKCKSNISKTEGCSFVMGDILGHVLLTPELAILLHKGKVGPFYDFISSKGKPFGANLLWNQELKKIDFEMVEMPWEKTDLTCPICGKKIVTQNGFYKCENYVDREHGCRFWIGKILGKVIPKKQIEKMLKEGKTDLISGFKREDDSKFDAFLVWNRSESKIEFVFPERADMLTNYFCPICNGKILATSYGFKCENYKAQAERKDGDCSFYLGSILGHTIKEKELKVLLSGGMTELVSFKNADKKTFEAHMRWDKEQGKVALVFDENKSEITQYKCPICHEPIIKNKYGYFCSKIDGQSGCQFGIGAIAGVLIDERQFNKLLSQGKTDLISGFKPKEKGKNPFSAFLKWDTEEQKVVFEFPEQNVVREISKYTCPVCRQKKLIKTTYSYSCDCGFRVPFTMATKEIPEEQITKLLLRGETDLITGFFSARTRKRFSAKLKLIGNKVEFLFPEKES